MLKPFEMERLQYFASKYCNVRSTLDALVLRGEAEYAASLISPALPQWLEAKMQVYQLTTMANLLNRLEQSNAPYQPPAATTATAGAYTRQPLA